MNIKIIVATHKLYWMPNDNVYLPLHVGRGMEGAVDLGYLGDNTGDNISGKNKDYCELTGIYWAWKNIAADYIGISHYRRQFTRCKKYSNNDKKNSIINCDEWNYILKKNPIVVPKKRKYYVETIWSQYIHAHSQLGLDYTKGVLLELYPEYEYAWNTVMNRTWGHMFNMFVMRRDYFNSYCQWLFSILFTLERRYDLAKNESRIYGFIAERLLDVWLEANHLAYLEQNVSFLERQNWIKKGGNFLIRKLRS